MLNSYEKSKLSEPEISDMNKMLREILIIAPIFGINAFEESAEQKPKREVEKRGMNFTLEGKDYNAKGIFLNDKFIVTKGSKVRKIEAASLQESTKLQRKELISSGVLISKGNYFEFSQDFSFESASTTAQVISGSTINGRTTIKIKDKTFADWYQESLNKVDKMNE